ncbi:MAG: peptide-methionine (S)-S-oxide reductase MsrA [Gammaproteobacteria bacterium]|nr:peptide-methionine (S)-S-oxide reductase MsrA [Gammaproteobacteria bacterium]
MRLRSFLDSNLSPVLMFKAMTLPSPAEALPGRDTAISITAKHAVNGHTIVEPFAAGCEKIILGMGCFWGAERKFWLLDGVYSTAVGYSAGITRNPSYQEVCSGMTGHNEVVLVAYQPELVSTERLLKVFWESHDPTQGMGQGNDRGTQYRSGIYYYTDQQKQQALSTQAEYQAALKRRGFPAITTEILPASPFYYAEEYHQQYLAKNPTGYCGLGGTGVTCP